MTRIAADSGTALWQMLYSSVIASVGVSVVFALAVLGLIRTSEMRRAERSNAAAAYGVLAAVALLAALACVVYGLVLMAQKS